LTAKKGNKTIANIGVLIQKGHKIWIFVL